VPASCGSPFKPQLCFCLTPLVPRRLGSTGDLLAKLSRAMARSTAASAILEMNAIRLARHGKSSTPQWMETSWLHCPPLRLATALSTEYRHLTLLNVPRSKPTTMRSNGRTYYATDDYLGLNLHIVSTKLLPTSRRSGPITLAVQLHLFLKAAALVDSMVKT